MAANTCAPLIWHPVTGKPTIIDPKFDESLKRRMKNPNTTVCIPFQSRISVHINQTKESLWNIPVEIWLIIFESLVAICKQHNTNGLSIKPWEGPINFMMALRGFLDDMYKIECKSMRIPVISQHPDYPFDRRTLFNPLVRFPNVGLKCARFGAVYNELVRVVQKRAIGELNSFLAVPYKGCGCDAYSMHLNFPGCPQFHYLMPALMFGDQQTVANIIMRIYYTDDDTDFKGVLSRTHLNRNGCVLWRAVYIPFEMAATDDIPAILELYIAALITDCRAHSVDVVTSNSTSIFYNVPLQYTDVMRQSRIAPGMEVGDYWNMQRPARLTRGYVIPHTGTKALVELLSLCSKRTKSHQFLGYLDKKGLMTSLLGSVTPERLHALYQNHMVPTMHVGLKYAGLYLLHSPSINTRYVSKYGVNNFCKLLNIMMSTVKTAVSTRQSQLAASVLVRVDNKRNGRLTPPCITYITGCIKLHAESFAACHFNQCLVIHDDALYVLPAVGYDKHALLTDSGQEEAIKDKIVKCNAFANALLAACPVKV